MLFSISACLVFVASSECKFGLLPEHGYTYSVTTCDACAVDHVVRFTRPSPSVFAYCKRSNTGAGEGLGMRLVGITGSLHCSIVICERLTLFNSLTTNDDYSRHRNSAASLHQLAQSVLKIGSALAERVGQGEVGGCTAVADSAWWLL